MVSSELAFAAVFVKCSVFFASFPLLRTYLSGSIIGALAVAFAVSLSPLGVEQGEPAVILFREACTGFCLALPLVLALEQLNMVGRGVDVARGAQSAEVLYAQERHSLIEGYCSLLGGLWLTIGGGYQTIYAILSVSPFLEKSVPTLVVNYLGDSIRLLVPLLLLSLLFEIGGGLLARVLNGVPLVSELTALRLKGGFVLGVVYLADLFVDRFVQ